MQVESVDYMKQTNGGTKAAKTVEHKFSRQVERRIYCRVAELLLMQTVKMSRRERRELAKLYGYEAYRMSCSLMPLKKVNMQMVNYVMMSGKNVMEGEDDSNGQLSDAPGSGEGTGSGV